MGVPKEYKKYGGKPYVSTEINGLLNEFNTVHEVLALYYPERNRMGERLKRSLKDRLVQVNKD